MPADKKDKKRIIQGFEIIVDEAKSAARGAINRTDAIGEGLRETLEGALSGRENVVMVRLNRDSLERLDELVEAGVVGSRSEAAAFLVGEGITRRKGMFDRMSAKVDEIRKAKEDLRRLLEEEGATPLDQDEEEAPAAKE